MKYFISTQKYVWDEINPAKIKKIENIWADCCL